MLQMAGRIRLYKWHALDRAGVVYVLCFITLCMPFFYTMRGLVHARQFVPTYGYLVRQLRERNRTLH